VSAASSSTSPPAPAPAKLKWVDIAAGWDAVQVATQVRDWRARKNLIRPTWAAPSPSTEDPVARSTAAATPEDFVAVWAANENAWTDEYTAAAAARKTQLAQTA
jgi:hypothetical protein